MTRKSATERIDSHEKLCKIMQKQTFTEIREIKERILRLEKMILEVYLLGGKMLAMNFKYPYGRLKNTLI